MGRKSDYDTVAVPGLSWETFFPCAHLLFSPLGFCLCSFLDFIRILAFPLTLCGFRRSTAPYRCDQGGRVIDRANEEIALFPEAHAVLHELHSHPRWQGVQVAYASRTTCGDFADECLQLIRVRSPDGVHGPSLREVAHHFQIFPGEKIAHFRAIAKASGLAYEDMVRWEGW